MKQEKKKKIVENCGERERGKKVNERVNGSDQRRKNTRSDENYFMDFVSFLFCITLLRSLSLFACAQSIYNGIQIKCSTTIICTRYKNIAVTEKIERERTKY